MTVYLTLDTSERSLLGVAREAEDGTIEECARKLSDDARHHVENLTPMTARVLKAAGIERPDVVVVGTGPASFTGLRSGLMTARALAWAWGVPIVGVSSLEVMALAACEAGAEEVVACIDARRKELFALRARALGSDDVEVLEEACIISPSEMPERLAERSATLAVQRNDLYPDYLANAQVYQCEPATTARLARAHMRRAEAGESALLSTEPQYLRRPDIHGMPA